MVHEVERSTAEFLAFNSRGKLVSGIHPSTWEEFFERFVYNGRREYLLRGLLAASLFLRAAGCLTVYVGGSYTTAKKKPKDLDIVWKSEEVNWRYLAQLAPIFLDTSRSASRRQKRLFRGEFFPSEGVEAISGKTFFEFFQRDRQNRRRGLVALNITVIPTTEELQK